MEGSHIALGVEYARKYKRERRGYPRNRSVTTAMLSAKQSLPALFRLRTLFPPQDRAQGAKTLRTTSNAFSSLRKFPQASPALKGLMPFRRAEKFALWFLPKRLNDERMPYIAHEIAKKIESEMEYPGQIKVNIIRESRVSAVANNRI